MLPIAAGGRVSQRPSPPTPPHSFQAGRGPRLVPQHALAALAVRSLTGRPVLLLVLRPSPSQGPGGGGQPLPSRGRPRSAAGWGEGSSTLHRLWGGGAPQSLLGLDCLRHSRLFSPKGFPVALGPLLIRRPQVRASCLYFKTLRPGQTPTLVVMTSERVPS